MSIKFKKYWTYKVRLNSNEIFDSKYNEVYLKLNVIYTGHINFI